MSTMDQVTLGHQQERHLEEDGATIRMTNAATNTPAGEHAQLALHLRSTGSGGPTHLDTLEPMQVGAQIPQLQLQVQVQRKKRGPKAGRKAALAVATAMAKTVRLGGGGGAGSTSASHLGQQLSGDLQEPAAQSQQLTNQQQRRLQQQANDPYAFHCDSASLTASQFGSLDSINERRQSPVRDGSQIQKQPRYLSRQAAADNFESASASASLVKQEDPHYHQRQLQVGRVASPFGLLSHTSSALPANRNDQKQLQQQQQQQQLIADRQDNCLRFQAREAPHNNPIATTTSGQHYQEKSNSAQSRPMIVHKQQQHHHPLHPQQQQQQQQQPQQVLGPMPSLPAQGQQQQQLINMQPQQQQQLEQAHYAPAEPQPQYSSNTSADHYNMYQNHHDEPQMFHHQAQQQQHQVAPNRGHQANNVGQLMNNHNRLAQNCYNQNRYNAVDANQAQAAPQVPPSQQAPPYQQVGGYEQQQQPGNQPLIGGSQFEPPPLAPHQRGLVGSPMRQQTAQPRMVPYASQQPQTQPQPQHQQQQIPVRSMMAANKANQQQQLQYKREMQQASGQQLTSQHSQPLPPQQQQQQHQQQQHAHIPNSNPHPLPPHHQHQQAYAPASQASHGYHMSGPAQAGPFLDQVEQYSSNSPTLLQQQLNRQTGPQSAGVPPHQRLANSGVPRVIGPQPPPSAVKAAGCRPTRYEQTYQHQPEQVNLPPQNRPAAIGAPVNRAEQTYYPAVSGGGAAHLRQVSGAQQVRARQQQQQMMTAGQMPPEPNQHHNAASSVVHHHHNQQQQQQHNQLLGNPTPPLTPTPTLTNAAPIVSHLAARPPVISSAQQVAPESRHWQHGHLMNDVHVQQASNINGPNEPSLQAKQIHQGESSAAPSLSGQHRIMPKNVTNHGINNFQYQQAASNQGGQQLNQHHHHNHNHNVPTSHQVPLKSAPQNLHQHHHHQPQQIATQLDMPSRGPANVDLAPSQTRLTLPLREAPLLGPFRLDHDAQYTSKVFHIKARLFETLSKSMQLVNPQAATVIQELQFRAYLIKPTSSSSSSNSQHQQGDSLLASNSQPADSKTCNWPELFQLSINQNVIHLDRSKAAHKAVDIFQYCNAGDNMLEIQVNDCYCTHEFVMEAVDRPTLKAFMNSCFKSRQLPIESCIQKLKFNFGSPGFLIQNQHIQQSANIINEYVTEFVQGAEQTRTRISLRCPISARRMRTPTRGHNCKHLQCFDLENFLYMNRERSQWNCPICSLPILFNMLELDQHQINIVQAMSEILNTDDLLMDATGQWQTYYGPPQASSLGPPQPLAPPRPATTGPQASLVSGHSIPQAHPSQAQSAQATKQLTSTYHPQMPAIQNGAGPIPAAAQQQHHHQQHHLNQSHHNPHHHQQQQQQQHLRNNQSQPMRPMSGPGMSSLANRNGPGGPIGSPASWDGSFQQHDGMASPHLMRGPPPGANQGCGRRSANGSPLAKKPYAGQYAAQADLAREQQSQATMSGPTSSSVGGSPALFSSQHDIAIGPSASFANQDTNSNASQDDLSPLAAMERAIIQHEQQMGPPPFDPNSLTSSNTPIAAVRNSAGNQCSMISTPPSSQQAQQITTTSNQPTQLIPTSPNASSGAGFSPAQHGVSSPAARGLVPASPQQQQQQSTRIVAVGQPAADLPQSPMQQQQSQQAAVTSLSTPATPSSSMLILGGPETPATPSNSGGQHCGPASVSAAVSHSPHVGSTGMGAGQQQAGVDHQPLSNGSASAGSITSSSTMTPSGQSLGSVGMGGDSRCGTAPLQLNGPLGLDDLMLPGGSLHSGSSQFKQGLHSANSPSTIDEKNEILMGKLMMDSNESILRDHRNGDLAIALEEADWKQQLDRGKSEHLANFLNEPLMKRQQNHHHFNNHQQQQQQQQHQQHQAALSKGMISGGLNPSDDEGANQSHNSSPSHNLDQVEFANYLDADAADNGAGLPPDDSILDLFER